MRKTKPRMESLTLNPGLALFKGKTKCPKDTEQSNCNRKEPGDILTLNTKFQQDQGGKMLTKYAAGIFLQCKQSNPQKNLHKHTVLVAQCEELFVL